MRVRFGDGEQWGRAVDLRDAGAAAGEVATAVRDPDDARVACCPPRAVHEHAGVLRRGVAVSVPAAVAAAARSRGATTDHDAELRAVERELAAVEVPDVDLAAARERVADTAADVDRLQEAVARASGRVEARREDGDAPEDAEAALREATRDLAAAETDHHAAREALEAALERAREARDARERRFALQDRRENLRRAARRELVADWRGRFRRALEALPVPGTPAPPRSFAGPDWAAAAAVARLARPGAPLVVGDDAPGFEDPTRASAALDAPVLLVEV